MPVRLGNFILFHPSSSPQRQFNYRCEEGTCGYSMEGAITQPSPGSPQCRAGAAEGYMDLLAERRRTSDLRWATRDWQSHGDYQYGTLMTRSQIAHRVLHSERVRHTIAQLVEESGRDPKELEAEVEGILEQMGHTQELGIIRQFAFVLPKVMKRIYGRVLINEQGIEKLRSTMVDTPVVLLPMHRSYADFLLISYISYHFNLPLPVIAAGMDFMNMAVIGDKLRGSGAFYIRRSFMDNALYWAVFQEYVHTIIYTGSPLEFFLEGTRSRSGKSLPPKLGLLGCVSECWLRGKLPDLAIVPISISYERTLEETLYAYELLGVPKPPESTSGLLKATSILKEKFGDIYIHVGEPVSMRGFLGPWVDRHLSASVPTHLSTMSKAELCACEKLGYHVLRRMQHGAVCSVWGVVCMQLACILSSGRWSLPLATLVQEVSWLIGILKKIGASVAIEGEVREAVVRSLEVHKKVASLERDGTVHIQQLHQPGSNTHSSQKKIKLSPATVSRAVTHLLLQHYVNQVIHHFIRPALVAHALLSLQHRAASTMENLKQRFAFLRTLFGFDFIFEKNAEGRDFMDGLSVLTWSGEVTLVQEEVLVTRPLDSSPLLTSLLALLAPFTLTYTSAALTLESQPWPDNGPLVAAIQSHVERSIGSSGHYSALSLDSIRHAIRALTKMGAVTKTSGEDGVQKLVPDQQKLASVVNVLSRKLSTGLLPKL